MSETQRDVFAGLMAEWAAITSPPTTLAVAIEQRDRARKIAVKALELARDLALELAADSWVSVEERLPETHASVLVTVEWPAGKGGFTWTDGGRRVAIADYDGDTWAEGRDSVDDEIGRNDTEHVTHWRQLPEPPK